MKALEFSEFGDALDVLQLVDVDRPDSPTAGHVLVGVEYSAIEAVYDLTDFKAAIQHLRRGGKIMLRVGSGR